MSGVNEIEIQYRTNINSILDKLPVYYRNYINFMNDVAIRTKYRYLNIVINFMKHIDSNIEDLSFDDFNNYIAEIKYKNNGEQNSSSYQITIYSALKKFCEYLYVSKKIQENYMLYIKRPKFVESQNTIEKRAKSYLNEREIKKLVRNIDNELSDYRTTPEEWRDRDKAIIYTFLNTGIRCSALMAIDIDDVNLKNKTLVVTDKGSKVKKYSISDELCLILKKWINSREALGVFNNTKALFISNRRQRMTSQSIYKIVKKYSECLDKNITPHKLRATYGTQLYNKTGDIYFVQDCMGHSNPKTTELYIREKKQNTKRASDIMSKLI